MKKVFSLIAAVAVISLLVYGYFAFANAGARNTDANTTQETTENGVAQDGSSSSSATKVSVFDPSDNTPSWLELLGTVKANDQIKIFATASGQIQQVLAEEGTTVKKGDPLFYIGGVNGTKAAVLVQFETAQKNYDNAVKGVTLARQGNSAALNAAQLQLESAKHQTAGSSLDMQVIDENLSAAKAGLNLLQDTYTATANKNEDDIQKARDGIDDLNDNIRDLEDQRNDLENGGNDPTGAQLEAIDKTIDDLNQKLKDARYGYRALLDGIAAGQNQLLSQIMQSKTQSKVLYLNQLSAESKLGLEEGSSDPQKMAEASLEATKIKNDASTLQAQAQVDMAKSNLELAAIQADSLIARAPIDGIVGDISAHKGDIVGQQSMLAQVYGQSDYELEVGVDSVNADLITSNSKAEVMIGGRYVPVTIKNVSLSADASTKLVNVAIALPKVNFRTNVTLRVRIAIDNNAAAGRESGDVASSRYIPLDAVIIGTEEQYVYVLDGGKAKKQIVKTGEVNGDMIQVLDGLNSTDKVIVDGAKSLMEGQEVTI